MYKVLWFDDEYETLEEIDEIFLDNGIQLSGVSNAKDGLYLLRERRMDFDAILLDGMFFNDSDQSGDPNESAF
ncbi:MAG: DNA-binding response OmpR family regulator, partial [Flavobacteriaceae bacterium]